MRRATRILLVLPLVIMAAYVVGLRGTTGEALPGMPQNNDIIIGCVHYWDSSFDCPQGNPQPRYWVPADSVQSIQITLNMKDDTEHTWTHPMSMAEGQSGRNVDAVFLRKLAVENFHFAYLREKGVSADSIQRVRVRLPHRPQ